MLIPIFCVMSRLAFLQYIFACSIIKLVGKDTLVEFSSNLHSFSLLFSGSMEIVLPIFMKDGVMNCNS